MTISLSSGSSYVALQLSQIALGVLVESLPTRVTLMATAGFNTGAKVLGLPPFRTGSRERAWRRTDTPGHHNESATLSAQRVRVLVLRRSSRRCRRWWWSFWIILVPPSEGRLHRCRQVDARAGEGARGVGSGEATAGFDRVLPQARPLPVLRQEARTVGPQPVGDECSR